MSVAIADQSLSSLLITAALKLLEKQPDLSGLDLADVHTRDKFKRPILVVNAITDGERIYQSGVFSVDLTVDFLTTNKTPDETFLKWEGRLWNLLSNTELLPGLLNDEGEGIVVHAAMNPTSSPSEFSDLQRDITYTLSLVAAKVAAE